MYQIGPRHCATTGGDKGSFNTNAMPNSNVCRRSESKRLGYWRSGLALIAPLYDQMKTPHSLCIRGTLKYSARTHGPFSTRATFTEATQTLQTTWSGPGSSPDHPESPWKLFQCMRCVFQKYLQGAVKWLVLLMYRLWYWMLITIGPVVPGSPSGGWIIGHSIAQGDLSHGRVTPIKQMF